MTRSFATALGMSSLMLLAVLVVNDVQSLFGSPGFPRVITTLMVCIIAILANAYFTYKVVRGTKPEPSYSMDELSELVATAARTVVREELELATGRAYLNMAGVSQDTPPPPSRATPKPYIVREREGS